MCACFTPISCNCCAAGQSDDTPPKSTDSNAMSAAPTGLSNNARLVLASLAADADQRQTVSPEPAIAAEPHRFATSHIRHTAAFSWHTVLDTAADRNCS